jgi:hypothetical protein
MKFALLFLSTIPVSTFASASLPMYTPVRVSYEKLVDLKHAGHDANDDEFLAALKEVGMVSITDIPSWNKQALLETLERCVSANQVPDASYVFSDGTIRRTLATRSVAGDSEPLFDDNAAKEFQSDCMDRLEQESRAFRHVVQDVTEAVAARLKELMVQENGNTAAILHDASGEQHFDLQEVVNQGEHLEHLHCYYKHLSNEDTPKDASGATINWHTDQGLMLFFTPGQRNGEATDGFFIQLADGSAVEVEFDGTHDDLVVMLGDGVHQYVNPVLKESGSESVQLRAVPHELRLTAITKGTPMDGAPPRLWYGRMVLPPPQALHPSSARTFQEMRSSMINKDPEALQLGCASHHQIARELADGEDGGDDSGKHTLHCNNATSSLCWHECMNYTDYDVSPEICEESDLSLGCVNDEGLLWIDAIHNPAFMLGCVDLSAAGKSRAQSHFS